MISSLKERVQKIEERNKKVEEDKAWEASYTRRILLVIFTYITIAVYLNLIQVENPWLNAIVPAIGFTLSTLTLPLFKNLWTKYIRKKTS